jgi:hypothetical protein
VLKQCMLILILLSTASAKEKLRFEKIEKDGVEFIATGKMIPKELWEEYQKLLKALKQARKTEKSAHKRLKDLLDEIPGREIEISDKLKDISDNLKKLGREIDKLKGADIITHARIDFLYSNLLSLIDDLGVEIEKEFKKLWKELNNKKPRNEGWKFAITAYGSIDYATDKEDLMPIGGAALTASFQKNNMTMGLMLGAGASVIDGAALSWTFIPNLLFDIFTRLAAGPALIITQDLGNMEGADRMVYAAGPKVQTEIFGLELWGIISAGVHGERGYGRADPTYSFNSGFIVGADHTFLQ